MSPYESAPAGGASETGSRSATSVPLVDLLALNQRERDVWDSAYMSGYCTGHEAGAQWADDNAASLFAAATRSVHAMAGLPEVDPQAARQAALRREQRWSA